MTIRSQQVAPALSVNRLNLDRLLSRLEHIVLTDDGSLHLKHDVYERRRVSAVSDISLFFSFLFFSFFFFLH